MTLVVSMLRSIRHQNTEFSDLIGPILLLWCTSKARALLQDLRVSTEPCVLISN